MAGPTLCFYAVEQGRLFAADAARATLLGLVGVAAFCIAYARASTRLHWAPCLLIGWTSFAVVTMLIHRVNVGAWLALIAAVATLFGARAMLPAPNRLRSRSALRRVTPKPSAKAEPVSPSARTLRWDLSLRMLSAAVLVFVLTSAADRLGPSLSGILTPFPVATAILAGFTHAQRGSAACVEFLRSYIPGLCGFAIFCVVLATTLPVLSIAWSFSAALVIQLALQTWLFRRVFSA